MKILALLSMPICLIIMPSFAKAQSLPACNAAQVTYESAPKDIEDRIRVVKETRPSGPPAAGTRVNSTQGTRWLVEVDPNYMKQVRGRQRFTSAIPIVANPTCSHPLEIMATRFLPIGSMKTCCSFRSGGGGSHQAT